MRVTPEMVPFGTSVAVDGMDCTYSCVAYDIKAGYVELGMTDSAGEWVTEWSENRSSFDVLVYRIYGDVKPSTTSTVVNNG